MAQGEKALAAEHGDLSSVLGTSMVEGGHQLPQILLLPLHTHHGVCMLTYRHARIHTYIYVMKILLKRLQGKKNMQTQLLVYYTASALYKGQWFISIFHTRAF